MTTRFSPRQPSLQHRLEASMQSAEHPYSILREQPYGALLAEEMRYRKPFLRAYAQMAEEAGASLDALWLFKEHSQRHAPRLYGNMPLIAARDLQHASESEKSLTAETVTQYRFFFTDEKILRDEHLYSAPFYQTDERVWQLLGHYGVGEKEEKTCNRLFLWMADFSGHEYLHQILWPDLKKDPGPLLPSPGSVQAKIHPVEYLALALHARICQRLCEDPRRMSAVLGKAAEYFDQLHAMQQAAYGSPECRTEQDRGAIDEAITYLADIYAHRLFRVVNPADKRLTRQAIGTDGGSLEEYAAQLRLFQPQSGGALKTLVKHTEKFFGPLYARIHLETTVPIMQAGETQSHYVPLAKAALEISLDDFAQRLEAPVGMKTEKEWTDWLKHKEKAPAASPTL